MEFDSPDAFLAHVLWTFRSYLNTLVLVGGFAVRLYEIHPRAAPAAARVLRTFDADLATPSGGIPLAGESLSALAEAAGFQPDFRGDHIPPVMKLVPKEAIGRSIGVDQYSVEFLTPMTGAPVRRSGTAVVTSDIQAGVTAQRLRYLDLLLESPWRVPLAGLPGIPEENTTFEVRLPHPGFFIVQKILISEERNLQDKRPKDMASVYQVVSLFRRELIALAEDVRVQMGATPTWRKWLVRFKRLAGSLFGGPTAPGVTEAYTVLQVEIAGSGLDVPSPQMIHAGVSLFLKNF
ncbi:MAG: hypothetical protein HY574_14500 [candidate division NC10 bacterium]|nr:hypothetical protein [candidate division NC10 bacterium]